MRVAATGQMALTLDVVLRAFELQRVHEADQRQLRRAVVGLAEIAVEAGGRGGHHDAAVVLRRA